MKAKGWRKSGNPPRGWDGKGGSHSQRKADNLLFLGRGAGGGGIRGGYSPLPLPFLCPDPDIGVHRFYFFPRAPAKNPIFLFAPILLCFSGMCFHLKTTLNGALFFFPVLKIENSYSTNRAVGMGVLVL